MVVIAGAHNIAAMAQQSNGQSQLIDIKANLVYPHKINDTLSVLCLVGEFAAQHNGAVITADSAVRFENERLECFGNVLINKNTTYAYADEATYDSQSDVASLYAPLIKVVDEDVTLYTYNFTFNTYTNVGEYWGGGVTIKENTEEEEATSEEEDKEISPTEDQEPQKPSVMESERGYYFADTKVVVGVDDVEFEGDGYEMTGDSVAYDMAMDRAYFFEKTNIWSGESDYIYGDEGVYDKVTEICEVFRNGYILTSEQEAWSDSIEYFIAKEEAILRNNIQIDDTTNKSMAFGDFAHYWGEEERVLLTRNPAILSYDSEEGQMVDTLFLRGDTILMRSKFLYFDRSVNVDSLAIDSMLLDSTLLGSMPLDSMQLGSMQLGSTPLDSMMLDSMLLEQRLIDSMQLNPLDSTQLKLMELEEQVLSEPIDSVAHNSAILHATPPVINHEGHNHIEEEIEEQIEEQIKEEVETISEQIETTTKNIEEGIEEGIEAQEGEEMPADTMAIAEIDSSELKRQERAEKLAQRRKESDEKEHLRLIGRQEKLIERIIKREAKEKSIYSDSMVLVRVMGMLHADSIKLGYVAPDTLSTEQPLPEAISEEDHSGMIEMSMQSVEPADSVYRTVFAYGDVRLYRSDVQLVCDSLVAQSIDTTLRLFINPILWSDNNQIVSETMYFYTKNGVLDYGEFIGNPIMSSDISAKDTLYYNQVTGKTMYAYFEDNQLVRNDVDGNVHTIYFMQDEATGIATTISKILSGHASFYINNQVLEGITYRMNPEYVIAPLIKIPVDMALYLDGFKWYDYLRPTRNSVFDKKIRPSIRKIKSKLPRPKFPIHNQIDTERESLIDSGEWEDRTDGVSEAATEWMRSLGFTPGEPRPADMQF